MIRVHLNPHERLPTDPAHVDVRATQIATEAGVLVLFGHGSDDPVEVFAPGVWARTERLPEVN